MTTTSPVNRSLEDLITSWRNIELNTWLTQTLPSKEVNSVKNKPSPLIARENIVMGVRTSNSYDHMIR